MLRRAALGCTSATVAVQKSLGDVKGKWSLSSSTETSRRCAVNLDVAVRAIEDAASHLRVHDEVYLVLVKPPGRDEAFYEHAVARLVAAKDFLNSSTLFSSAGDERQKIFDLLDRVRSNVCDEVRLLAQDLGTSTKPRWTWLLRIAEKANFKKNLLDAYVEGRGRIVVPHKVSTLEKGPYAFGSHPVIAEYDVALKAMAKEEQLATEYLKTTVRPAAAITAQLEAVVRRALDSDVAEANGLAASAEAARIAMDLLYVHQKFLQEGLLKTLAYDLATGAVDAIRGTVDGVAYPANEASLKAALTAFVDEAVPGLTRAATRLAGRRPRERAALAMRRALVTEIIGGSTTTTTEAAKSLVSALVQAGRRLGDKNLTALVDSTTAASGYDETTTQDDEDDVDDDSSEASPRRRSFRLLKKKKMPLLSPRPSSESDRPPTPTLQLLSDDDEPDEVTEDAPPEGRKEGVDTARALVAEAVLAIARIAVSLRTSDPDDVQTIKKREKDEDLVFRGAASDAARNAQAEFFLLHSARALRRHLRFCGVVSSDDKNKYLSVLDDTGDDISPLVVSWLEKLEESAVDNYLLAWEGASKACGEFSEREKRKLSDGDPKENVKLLKKRVAAFNAHVDRLALPQARWPDPHPEIGNYLRKILVNTVCGPWRTFHDTYLNDTPFAHKYHDHKILRWTPDLLDNAVRDLFAEESDA